MAKFSLLNETVQMAFSSEDRYLSFGRLLQDTACEKVLDYSKEEANNKIREVFNGVLGVDETTSRKDLRKAMRRNKVALFEVIEDTLDNLLVSGWQENEFFNQFVETKNIALGDENEFYSPDESILTVSEVSGNHHSLIRQKLGAGTRYPVKMSWFGVKFYEEFEVFMAGGIDWAGLVAKLYEAIDQKLNVLLYDGLMGAKTKLAPNSQFNITGEISSATKDQFFQLISDVEVGTGKEVVIMGTKAALRKLAGFVDAEWISNNMKDTRQALGHLGVIEGGYKMVEIPQRFAKNTTSAELVDTKTLLIMPVSDNRFIKLVNGGETILKEVTDGNVNADMTYEYEVQYKLGVAIVINMLFGVWTIS